MSAADWHDLHTDVAKHTIAHLKGAEVRGGVLGVLMDVTDPADLKQLAKTGYVSPYIDWDYTDPRGHLWPGPSILHVAVTPVPIQIEQEPFEGTDGAFLSSVAQWQKSPKKKRQPVFLSGARLQPISLGSNMADDKKHKKPETEEEIVVDEETTPEPTPEPEPPIPEPPALAPPPAQVSMEMKKLLLCLAEQGLVLGQDTTIETLPGRLLVACETKRAVEAMAEEKEREQEPEEEQMPQEEPLTANPPVMMSQADIDQLKAERDRYKETAINVQRHTLRARIAKIGKKLGAEIEQDLTAKLLSAAVALSAAGELEPSPLLAEIEAYEKVLTNPNLKGVTLSGKPKVAGPHDGNGGKPKAAGVDVDVVNRLSGGRYDTYREGLKNGQ